MFKIRFANWREARIWTIAFPQLTGLPLVDWSIDYAKGDTGEVVGVYYVGF